MDFSNKLNISQGLKHELGLKLTPEMRLRLDVLQATHLELMDILNQELSENPLLDDFVDEDEEPAIKGDPAEKEELPDDEYESPSKTEITEIKSMPAAEEDYSAKEEAGDKKEITEDLKMTENDSHMDEYDSGEYENVFENESYDMKTPVPDYNPEMGKFDEYKYNSMTREEKKDLSTELIRQLNQAGLSDELYLSVSTLISSLDEKGFLDSSLSEISALTSIPEENLAKGLEILHSFEPGGAGARDTKEALLIQLQLKGQKDTLSYQVIEKGFELLTRQNYTKLASMFRVKEEDIRKAEESIKELNPFPGSIFTEGVNEYVVPDIIVTEEDGKYKIHVPSNFPVMKVNWKLINEYKSKKETKDFIKAYEVRVREIMRALEERNKTIENLIKKIITYQEGYLHSEDAGLKPLTYKEIALESGVSESTVSRVVSKKYIQLPTGVFPLKKFFTAGIETSNGGGLMSNSVIKSKIKDIIDAEESKNPINDTDLEKMLKSQGIPVARRTVTKYREQLGILPANLRKK